MDNPNGPESAVADRGRGKLRTRALAACAGLAAALPVSGDTDLDSCYRAIDRYRDYNAFISVDRDPEPGPTGPLAGMVLAVKDNIHVAGMPNTADSSTPGC